MIKSRRVKHALPAWICCLAGVVTVWLILSGIGNALSGVTTLDENIGEDNVISVTAALPVTYTPQMDGEDYVYDNEGNLLFDETDVDATDAKNVVAWNFDSGNGTLRGEVSAMYSSGCLAPEMDSVKATVVFLNTHATDSMLLSFNYSYTTTLGTGGKLEGLVSGGNVSETGSVSIVLAPNESKFISLYSGSAMEGVAAVPEGDTPPEFGNVVLNLTNITVINTSQTASTTLVPASNGMYRADFVNADGDDVTYVVTTAAITPELRAEYPDATVVNANQEIEYRLGSGLTLTSIAADNNFRFGRWFSNSEALGNTSPVTVYPTTGSTVSAFYQQESYIEAFTVGNHTYYSWDAAVTDAVSSHNPIILNQNYTFPANELAAIAAGETLGTYVTINGDGLNYILPTNVRFVVPKSANDYGNFSNILPAGVTATTPITHFRTLTIPSGVTLQVNGEISVNGDYYCKQPYETVAGGAHALVSLNQNAKISVGNGGKIWCYGFIAGAGEVEIASGGHASEFLQICDWGGGSAALGWAMNTDNLFNAFYFSQYYVQNIEATLKVYEGATTEVAVAITAAGQVANSHAPFIGEGGMFHITESGGYIERVYDAATDRTNYNVHGDMETSGITVGIMQYQLSSDSYVLGINGNLSINVEEGKTTMLNDFMLLPGTQINVSENAEVEIAQTTTMNVVNQDTNEIEQVERPIRLFIVDDYEWNNTIDTTADPLTQLQQLNNGNASYSGTGAAATKHQNALPYTIANGSDNDDIRGNVTAESATINVDGEATFYSNVFTTNYVGYLYDTMAEMLSDPDQRAALEAQYGAATVAWAEGVVEAAYDASKDKLITGTGTIVNNEPVEGIDGTLNLLTQSGTTKNQVEIPTAGCLIDLSGDGSYSEIGTGTYASATDPDTGEKFWFKNQVTYHFVVIDPATQQPAGVLPDITRKVGVDYDVLTVGDLTVFGQRYAIFGFDASTIQSYNATTQKMDMQGMPIGFVPADGEIVKDGNFNLAGDSRNRNFVTPASWNALMSDPTTLMTYLMSNGVTSGWDELGFIFADLTVLSNSNWIMTDMLCGGLNGEITVYVVEYDNYVAFENDTTGERAQSYLPTGLTVAQYTMTTGEAVLTPTVTDPATGTELTGYTLTQNAANMETTLAVTGVDRDLLISMTAAYTKVQLTWIFQDASDGSVIYATEETVYEIGNDPAESPAFTNAAHSYYLMQGDQNVKLAERYTDRIADIATLSNETTATGTATLTGVSLTGITEPLAITVRVDAYDYKLSFTDDKDDAAIEDFYVKDGDPLVLRVSNILTDEKYCYDTASVTTGTATATVQYQGAELALTNVSSDAEIALTLRGYDYLIQYYLTNSIYYDFVTSGGISVYTYPEGYYDGNYAYNGSPLGAVYTHALEGQQATLTVQNVSRDNSYTLNVQPFDRALIVYDENDVIRMVAYANGSDTGNNYRYYANQYVKNLTNPNGAIIEDHLDQLYAYISTNGTGFFPVTVQIGTYYHVVEFRYFQPDGMISGTQLTDSNNVALSTRIFVEEEDGTVSIDTDDFLAAYTAGNKDVSMYETAGEKVFLYLANYSETGSSHTNTYDTSADAKTITVSNIGKNAFVNVIVVPYAYTVTITDSGLNTTNLYYVDASDNNITNSYKAEGTAPITYSAGDYRAIFGISELTNAQIDKDAQEILEGVVSITVSNIQGNASMTLDTRSTKHKLTITYVDPWGSTTEIVYPETEQYVANFTDRTIIGAVETTETALSVSHTENSFTVTLPDANTVTNITVEFRYIAEEGTESERLKLDVVNSGQFNNATGTTTKIATITVLDAYYGIFSVECAKPCVIAIDNGDGSYTRLIADAISGVNNTYSFSCPDDFDTDIKLVVAVKGDVNGDGKVNTRDRTQIGKALLDATDTNKITLSGLNAFVADVNEDGKLNTRDRTRIGKALLDENALPFEW